MRTRPRPYAFEGRGGTALPCGRGSRERRGHCKAGWCGAREGGLGFEWEPVIGRSLD